MKVISPSLSNVLFAGLINETTGLTTSRLLFVLGLQDFLIKSLMSVFVSVPSGYLATHSSFKEIDVPFGALFSILPSL